MSDRISVIVLSTALGLIALVSCSKHDEPTSGLTGTVLVRSQGLSGGLATDGASLYFGIYGSLFRMPVTGGARTVVSGSADPPVIPEGGVESIATGRRDASGRVPISWFAPPQTVAIMRDASEPPRYFENRRLAGPSLVAVDDGAFAWCESLPDSTIEAEQKAALDAGVDGGFAAVVRSVSFRATADGDPTPTVGCDLPGFDLTPALAGVPPLGESALPGFEKPLFGAADATTVYLLQSTGYYCAPTRIYAVDKATNAIRLVTDGTLDCGGVVSLAVDDRDLYFSNENGPIDRILRVCKAGGPIEIVQGATSWKIWSLAVDDGALYWIGAAGATPNQPSIIVRIPTR